jgi:hypothetical protein
MSSTAATPPFHVAIPSRGRARGLFLQTYRKLVWRHGLEGVTTVFVQTPEDLEAYAAALPRVRVVLAEGEGLAAAQEAIRAHYPAGSRVVVAHDDVTRVVRLRDGRARRFEDVSRLFAAAFAVMEAYGLTLGGLAPTDNSLNEVATEDKVTLGLRFIYDPLHFEVVGAEPLPLVTRLKHDTERSIWHYRRSGGVLRLASFAVGTRHSARAPDHARKEALDLAALRLAYPEEIACFRRRKGGYSSVLLRPLPYRGCPYRAGEAELEAQALFDRLLGDFDVAPDLTLPGGRLLRLLQERKWRVNDQRTNVVPPELRVLVRSKRGTETLRADAPIFSEGFGEGEVFEACQAALPPGLAFDFVTVNRNLCTHRHQDAGNSGLSAIIFLGSFEGGALVLEDGRRFEAPGVLRVFDGRLPHWNEPITGGTKYSVIYYNRASRRLKPNCEVLPPDHPPPTPEAADGLLAFDGTPVPFR